MAPLGCAMACHVTAACAMASPSQPPALWQGQQLRVPDCDGAGMAKRSCPASKVGGTAERRYPVYEVRGGGQEEQRTPEARGSNERSYPKPWLCGCMRA